MRTELNEEAECRRIILLRGRKPEVLLAIEGSPRRSLQEILIPRWQRVAEHLTAALRETCGIDAVSLSSFEDRLSDRAPSESATKSWNPVVQKRMLPAKRNGCRSTLWSRAAFRILVIFRRCTKLPPSAWPTEKTQPRTVWKPWLVPCPSAVGARENWTARAPSQRKVSPDSTPAPPSA